MREEANEHSFVRAFPRTSCVQLRTHGDVRDIDGAAATVARGEGRKCGAVSSVRLRLLPSVAGQQLVVVRADVEAGLTAGMAAS